jgi:hypothetical protein
MAKETKKQKWQRIAKSVNVKFQDNDTIAMLVTATAHKVGVNPKELKGEELESTIEKIVTIENSKPIEKKKATKKATPKVSPTVVKSKPKTKAVAKSTVKAKSKKVVKKQVKVETPKELKPTLDIPKFKDVDSMKVFCVSCGLNRVDGYILETKKSKSEFLKWINKNIDKAVDVNTISTKETPHSPHSGIGELSAGITPSIDLEQSNKKGIVVTPKLDVPELSTGNNINELPTALSENKKMLEGESSNVLGVSEKIDIDKGKEMKNYGTSIIDTLMSAPMFRINGGITISDLNSTLANCSKAYNYELFTEKNGERCLIISDHEGNKCRLPRQGSLPMI